MHSAETRIMPGTFIPETSVPSLRQAYGQAADGAKVLTEPSVEVGKP